jgi:hypothetical protein
MPTLDEQFEEWLNNRKVLPSYKDAYLAGAAAKEKEVLAIATDLPRVQIEGCWYIDLDEYERHVRQRGEEEK